MASPAYLAQFLFALSLGFTLFDHPAEAKFRPLLAGYPISARQLPAQESCPIIKNYFPRIGYPGYGLTIEGENLGGVTEVVFTDAVSAKFEILSDREIAVTIPLGAVSGPIRVRKPGCPDAVTDSFTIPPSPEISVGPEWLTIPASDTAPIKVEFSSGLIVPVILIIESSNPNVASVPPALILPPGATSATFDVTGIAPGAPATITAMLPPNLGGKGASAIVS